MKQDPYLPPGCNNPDGLDPDYEAAVESLMDNIIDVVQHWSCPDIWDLSAAIKSDNTSMTESDFYQIQLLIARYGREAVIADALTADPAR